MSGHTVILTGRAAREKAHHLIDVAPDNAVVIVRGQRRTIEQNDKMWAMLTDISIAKPDDRRHTPETWKALFMHACGHAVHFEMGLSGEPFPVGFRSSRLTKTQMSELIEFILAWGTERGVRWSDESRRDAA